MHMPWQSLAELNGAKYLRSHAQVLLDITSIQDSIWFLAQDYLAQVHNLSTNRQIDWKIPESHILMFY
jgi:hypothetical protein